MNWLFKKKKENQDYYNEAYLLAVFSPKENLEKLKNKYQSMKKSNANHKKMKALMSGFMAGLEQRNRSRLEVLEKMREKDKKENERER
jgi:hypothetical protein